MIGLRWGNCAEVGLDETFGQMVFREREIVRHWKQKELAKRTGLDQSTISSVERDQGIPRSTTITVLAKALGFEAAPWLVKFGHIPALAMADADVVRLPVVPGDSDRRFDPRRIIAWVESKPDEEFQAQMAREKLRRSPSLRRAAW